MNKYLSQELQAIRNAEICLLYEQGFSLRQIAKKCGLSFTYIRLIVQVGSKLRPPGVPTRNNGV